MNAMQQPPTRPLQLGDPSMTSPEQQARRKDWITQQRLSYAEEVYIPVDFDPAEPYPREARA